jgi:hypothetical protein
LQGSLFIIVDVVKSKQKMSRTYCRILLGLSLYDALTSFAQGLSTWPIPAGTAGVKFASGTTTTCNFQGFFTQFGVGAPFYNCSLSVYYLVVIAFAFSESRVKRLEWLMHLIPISFSLATAIAGIPLNLYNSAGLWCWIAALPGVCVNGNNPAGKGECIRGENAWIYQWAIYYAEVWFCVLTITINMSIVTYIVWTKENASLKYQFGSSRYNSTLQESEEVRVKDFRRSRFGFKASVARSRGTIALNRPRLASQVFWQSFYYVIGFYITWIFPTVLRFMQTIGKTPPFFVLIAMACMLPLQGKLNFQADRFAGALYPIEILPFFLSTQKHECEGFLNCLIYVRARVVQYQLRHPEYGLCSAITRSIRRTVALTYSSESRPYFEAELQD